MFCAKSESDLPGAACLCNIEERRDGSLRGLGVVVAFTGLQLGIEHLAADILRAEEAGSALAVLMARPHLHRHPTWAELKKYPSPTRRSTQGRA
eukprot:CAMPEP_0204034534 /NCGR_PEP_ID=MMETSP0360-20130528/74135_1 /ASSEMBLY_ACC=CAM_ASM_000342 /TAXON_ID=268821 /ORGANISM="Scrippsiella Hangoei, Strain SHTV-5" /LENGTH=93 /DNA_ID=CAMNT_0050979361 /DNA_START=370 /DNA_END=651 /DNA_ORIENTATION=-